MPDRPRLVSVQIGKFKSYLGQTLTIEPLTLMIGRNGSGKSNALDALALLALLAEDRSVDDLERGDQEVAGVRGGLTGSAPYGSREVELACTISTREGETAELRVVLDASDRPEIISEKLTLFRRRELVLVDSARQAPGAGISDSHIYSGGSPRAYNLLSSRLATLQAITKIPADSNARRLVIDVAKQLISVLTGIFVLDPVPARMRNFARLGSSVDRYGSSLSSTLWDMRDDKVSWDRLTGLVRSLVDTDVTALKFSEAKIDRTRVSDVMVALEERVGGRKHEVLARNMSDGTLRYLAIVSSLIDLPRRSAASPTASDAFPTMVVEEIENGLFPSQGARILELLKEEAHREGVNLLATTHSPALLDAIKVEDHPGVVICERDAEGHSLLTRLIDHPKYVELAESGSLGRALTRGALSQPEPLRASIASILAS